MPTPLETDLIAPTLAHSGSGTVSQKVVKSPNGIFALLPLYLSALAGRWLACWLSRRGCKDGEVTRARASSSSSSSLKVKVALWAGRGGGPAEKVGRVAR